VVAVRVGADVCVGVGGRQRVMDAWPYPRNIDLRPAQKHPHGHAGELSPGPARMLSGHATATTGIEIMPASSRFPLDGVVGWFSI